MYRVPGETMRRFVAAMDAARIELRERGYYQKWLRYYLDFCTKYCFPPDELASLMPFIEKLASKNQTDVQRQQASMAVQLYIGMFRSPQQGPRSGGDAKPTVSRPRPQGSKSSSASLPVPGASWAKELDALRNTIRLRNYSPRTSETYIHWTRKF